MAGSSSNSCFKGGKFSAPGFRFHPTDEELVVYYLKRKICCKKLKVDVIGVTDVYKMDPSELPGLSLLKTGDRQWFFFTPRSRKYPNAARSGRGTASGYWKATGKDRIIEFNSRSVGLKKTLVFYRGRAPNGERTDWVMHEYTMNEEELERCKNVKVKDYYALYKLYKKSGAGPKNGEQYGAPFQEEEWVDADDDSEDADYVAVPDVPLVHRENVRRVDENLFCRPVNVQLDDIRQLLDRIPDAPGVFPRQINQLAGVPQGYSQEVMQSTLQNNSSGTFLDPRKLEELLPNSQPCYRQSSFKSNPRSANSFEATSGNAPLVFEEDYIALDDLLNSELGASSTEKSAQFLDHGEFGEVNAFDQYLNDFATPLVVEPVFQETYTDLSSLSNFANDALDQRQQLTYQQTQDQTPPKNGLNNFMYPSTTLDQLADDLWLKDDQANVFDQPQSLPRAFAPPLSGVMPEYTNRTQDQGGQNGSGTRSRISSSMGAWMESIPSKPAYACEGPLNGTYVRMSSFSRIRFNGMSVTTSKVTIAKKRLRNRGFLLLSIMGALCAIFWVFIATVGVMGRPVFA